MWTGLNGLGVKLKLSITVKLWENLRALMDAKTADFCVRCDNFSRFDFSSVASAFDVVCVSRLLYII